MADCTATDRLEPGLLARFHATLGPWLAPVPDGTAPLGAHWCLFPPLHPTESLGPDGHPPRLHPISEADYPRRMWVGGAITFSAPFPLKRLVRRQTRILPVQQKAGKSGQLLLAGLEQAYSAGGVMVATERQDFVYRPAHSGAAPPPAAVQPAPVPSADLRWEIDTGAALLFRYSALTFNAHRIHYDHDHARTVEGYADILVHGPLQATWLLNAAARLLGRAPVEFRYRALAPLSAPLGAIVTASLGPDGATGLVHDGTGRPTMEGHAR